MTIRGGRLILVAALVGAGALRWSLPLPRRFPLHQRAVAVLANARPFEARLSGSSRWTQCAPVGGASGVSAACGNYHPDSAHIAGAVDVVRDARSTANRPSGRTADAAWSLAVIDLALAARTETIDGATTRLAELVKSDTSNADLRNDLGVAYLGATSARTEAANAFLALDQIARAASLDTTSVVVAFNHALILTRTHLFEEAEAAWRAYLRRDPNGGWADEARGHIARLEAARAVRHFNPASPRAVEVGRDPQGAREHVLDVLLPGWATAIARGDLAASDSAATTIAAIGDLLASQTGDRSVSHLAGICRHAPRIADGVTEFADGSALFRRGAFGLAAPKLRDAARRLRLDGGAALASWDELLLGFVEIYGSRYSTADSLFARIERHAAANRDVALRARALWGLALSDARRGKTAEAFDHYNSAASLYRDIREHTNYGMMVSQLADPLSLLGRDAAALNAKFLGLAALDERRDARTRSSSLVSLGQALLDGGLPGAAFAVLHEAVRSANATDRPNSLPEALIQLAKAEAQSGRIASARAHLLQARSALPAIKDSLMLRRQAMTIANAEASVEAAFNPTIAIDRLDSVDVYYRHDSLGYDRAAPLALRAGLRLRIADTAGARRDLDTAIAAIERYTVNPTDAAARRDRAAVRRELYRTRIALDLARGDTLDAFTSSERSRGNALHALPAIRPGRVVLSYIVLSRETLLWIARSGSVRLVRLPVPEDSLRRAVEQLEQLVRAGDDGVVLATTSRHLSSLLLDPARPELALARDVVVVADGILGRLPFAVLRDSTNHYLIERVPIIYASAIRAAADEPQASGAAVVIGNPTFDRAEFPDLPPLAAASGEVAAIAHSYPSASIFTGAAATKSAVIAALRGATLFHFAGHARLVERAPQLSHLVLARGADGLASGVLAAAEIARLDLHRTRLVVLSSCGTTQSRSRRDRGVGGLSEAFLDAGAHAVISSLWEADDLGTAVLMDRVYRRLAAGDPPAEALRRAQAALSQSLPASRMLHVWAAFRYEEL